MTALFIVVVNPRCFIAIVQIWIDPPLPLRAALWPSTPPVVLKHSSLEVVHRAAHENKRVQRRPEVDVLQFGQRARDDTLLRALPDTRETNRKGTRRADCGDG